jgi:tetratricopeptide (TPR) repeat protein
MNSRFPIIVCLALAVCRGAGPSPEELFDEGMQAVARNDWDRGLPLLEKALTADGDNLRYGSEYRQAILRRARTIHPKDGRVEDFERPLKFFEQLVTANPKASNAFLNYGFAYVDKIPAAGSITQVILANTALSQFSKALALQPSWIAYYTRGMSYLFWPKIFGRAELGVADLEQALRLQKDAPLRPYHVRTWIGLGDGYWKIDQLEKARATWSAGLKSFPDNQALRDRVARQGDALEAVIESALDPAKRVNTDLKELWAQ